MRWIGGNIPSLHYLYTHLVLYAGSELRSNTSFRGYIFGTSSTTHVISRSFNHQESFQGYLLSKDHCSRFPSRLYLRTQTWQLYRNFAKFFRFRRSHFGCHPTNWRRKDAVACNEYGNFRLCGFCCMRILLYVSYVLDCLIEIDEMI